MSSTSATIRRSSDHGEGVVTGGAASGIEIWSASAGVESGVGSGSGAPDPLVDTTWGRKGLVIGLVVGLVIPFPLIWARWGCGARGTGAGEDGADDHTSMLSRGT